jgi:Flp pilus assembly pilin Flp
MSEINKRFASRLQACLRNARATTAVEYALIIAGITVSLIAVVFSLGSELNSMFSDLQTQLNKGS